MDDAAWLGNILYSVFPADTLFSVSETTGRTRVEWTVPEIDRRNVPLVIDLDPVVRQRWEDESVGERIVLEGRIRHLVTNQLVDYDAAGSTAIPEAVVIRVHDIDL
ncbi:hypothetical protein [Pandoraea pnomenusa]|uniref:hypothetical protein n=1 Tax=Pandoraea pnomenusa TaxID=93220 RepID=UPI001AC35BC9|nr:hypothetical protein [Pandoraea pnomenusa]MBN9092048.1 hypothetical protein [Pandoraea pnomenusa]